MWCGFVLFTMSALYFNTSVSGVFGAIPSLSLSALSFTDLPYAYLYLAKLFSMIVPDYRVFAVFISLISTAGLMLYIQKYCYYCAASAVTAVVTGFWLLSLYEPSYFLGLVISAFAYRYAFEKRFVRFAAILLLAACFMPEALIIIPLYLVFIIQPTVWHLPVAAGAAFFLLATNVTKGFTFIGEEDAVAADFLFPLLITVSCAACAVGMKILARRGSYNLNMIIVLITAAVLGVGSLNDGRLLKYALICFFPATLTLIPELVSVVKALISMVFRDKKKPVLICSGVVLLIIVGFVYGYILKNGYFGAAPYETWLGTEVTA